MKYMIGNNITTVCCYLFIAIQAASCSAAKKSETTPSKIEIGIGLYTFKNHSFAKALSLASDSAKVRYIEGFTYYKLGADFDNQYFGKLQDEKHIATIIESLKKNNLQMISMFLGGSTKEEWIRSFNLARGLGLQYIVSEPAKRDWDYLDSMAAVYNVKIAIHQHAKSHNSPYWHPDSVLVALEGHPNFRVCADLGHWARSGLDVVECLKKLEGYIVELHLKDVSALGEANAEDVNPGKGIIDWPGVLKELKRQRFRGIAYIECEHNFDNNINDVRETIQFISNLWDEK